jgi:hypothetical protein
MEQDELRKGADKVINVTYMLSGVLEQSFQEMDDILERLHKRLHHEDRRLITSIRKHIKFLNSNIESLRTHSLSKMDEETVECFDDTTLRFYVIFLRFYVIFMKLLEVAGIDYLCDLRLYSLYNLLDKYQSLTSYPKLDSRAKIAFLQVKRDIESGQYSAEDMKNVFKLKDENRDK